MPITFYGCFNGCFNTNFFGSSINCLLHQPNILVISKFQFPCANLDKQAFTSDRLGACLLEHIEVVKPGALAKISCGQ